MKEINMETRYKKKFVEMATIGRVGDITVKVFTDHRPVHFHLEKKDKYEAKIELKTLKILSYKWQKDGSEVSSKDIRKLADWLNAPSKKNKKITNYELIDAVWSTMNDL